MFDARPHVLIAEDETIIRLEAARGIYAERPVPIVMLTACGARGNVERALGAGVFGYVTKPFRAEDVVPALLSALARHEELLAARREVGRKGEPIELEVISPNGGSYPLKLGRLPDGTLDISLQNVK